MGSTHPVRAQAQGDQFPMARRLDEALPLLRRPFAPSAVRAKIQSQQRSKTPEWGQVIRYVDARLVSERLNLVVGGAGRISSCRSSGRSGPRTRRGMSRRSSTSSAG